MHRADRLNTTRDAVETAIEWAKSGFDKTWDELFSENPTRIKGWDHDVHDPTEPQEQAEEEEGVAA